MIIAPYFNKKILEIFNKKKRLILIECYKIKRDKKTEIKSINGGYLIQEKNSIFFSKKDMRCVTKKIALKKNQINLVDNTIPLSIKGTEGMVVKFPKCCYPIPGDPIHGFVTSGRGIVIHRQTCKNLAEYQKQQE